MSDNKKKVSGLTVVTTWADGDYLYLVDTSAGVNGSKIIEPEHLFNITLSSGIDITPGSDTDVDLLTVNVTGTPTLSWDESADRFLMSKPLADGLPPSGDATGATDYANIVAASAFGPVGLRRGQTYYIDTELQDISLYATGVGKDRWTLSWVGSEDATSYMIINDAASPADIDDKNVSEGLLLCNNLIGGLHIKGLTSSDVAYNMKVFEGKGIGMYFEDCWSSTFRLLFVSTNDGIGLKTYRANSTVWHNINMYKVTGTGTDECVIYHLGQTDLIKMDNVLFQSNNTGANPHLYFEQCESSVVNNVRFESNTATDHLIKYDPKGANPSAMGQRINGLALTQTSMPTYLVSVVQRCGLKMEGLDIATGLTNLIRLGVGNHAYPIIENSYIAGLTPEDYISFEASAVINPSGVLQYPAIRPEHLFDVTMANAALPTDAEFDTAFGTPATVGPGFIALVDANGAGTNIYRVVTDGAKWWYEALTEAT